MIRYFGHMYTAPMYFEAPEVPTPEGAPCFWCQEDIVAGDDGIVTDGITLTVVFPDGSDGVPYHRACFLRSVIGSQAHMEGRCGCYVEGGDEGDPPGLTVRQAAEAAVARWLELGMPRPGAED